MVREERKNIVQWSDRRPTSASSRRSSRCALGPRLKRGVRRLEGEERRLVRCLSRLREVESVNG